MSNFKQIEAKVNTYLNSSPINCQGLCDLFDEAPKMTIDAYLQQGKDCIRFLLYISQNSPNLLKEQIGDFLSDTQHIRPFLENQGLFTFTEWSIAESEIIRFIKYSGLIMYDAWQSKWSKLLKTSSKISIKNFAKEAAFLNQFYLKNKKKAEKSTWLQNIDWQTFLSLFIYHLHQNTQVNSAVSPDNISIAEPLFFILQHKKEGNMIMNQARFESLTDELIEQDFVQSSLLAIPKLEALQNLGYDDFQKTFTNYTCLLAAKKMLEHYCYSDNVALDFLNPQIARVYVKSVKEEINFRKNTLKYSYCSRFYNTEKGTSLENHFSAQSIKDYFMDFGFEINSTLKLKKKNEKDKNEKERFIRVDLIAEICEGLRNYASINCPYILLEKENFLKESFEKRWSKQYSKDEFETAFDFLATQLPFNGNSDTVELFKIPFFQLDNFLLWFPHLMMQTDFITGLLNKIWENIDKKEQNNVADKQAIILKKWLEKHGFRVFVNHRFQNIPDGNKYEFDVIAYKDGILFLFELKATNFRNSDKGISDHQKGAVLKSVRQLTERYIFVSEHREDIQKEFGKNCLIEVVCPFSVSSDFDNDHKCFFFNNLPFALKISFFELLIISRNERHRLFDKNLILEKILRLQEIEPLLAHFDLDKIDRRADEWVLYDEENLTAEHFKELIYQDTVWAYWTNDNWDMLSGKYISPNKELAIICNDESRKDILEIVEKYNWWQDFLVADMQNGGKALLSMPEPHKQEALKCLNSFLKLFPNHTGALLGRGKIYFALKEYDKAILDFEKIFEIDFAECTGLNPNENTAFDWLMIIYRHTQQIDKARQWIEKCLATYPEFYWGILILAELELEFGDEAKARELAKIYRDNIPMSDYPRRIHEAMVVRVKFGLKD